MRCHWQHVEQYPSIKATSNRKRTRHTKEKKLYLLLLLFSWIYYWLFERTIEILQHFCVFFCVFLFFFARQDSARTFMKTMDEKIAFLWFVICFNYGIQAAGIMDNVVFAVNCGGEAHTDVHGNERNFVFDSFVLNERCFLKE